MRGSCTTLKVVVMHDHVLKNLVIPCSVAPCRNDVHNRLCYTSKYDYRPATMLLHNQRIRQSCTTVDSRSRHTIVGQQLCCCTTWCTRQSCTTSFSIVCRSEMYNKFYATIAVHDCCCEMYPRSFRWPRSCTMKCIREACTIASIQTMHDNVGNCGTYIIRLPYSNRVVAKSTYTIILH